MANHAFPLLLFFELQQKRCRFDITLEGSFSEPSQHGFPQTDLTNRASGSDLDFAIEKVLQQDCRVFCAFWTALAITGLPRLETMFSRRLSIADLVMRPRGSSRSLLV